MTWEELNAKQLIRSFKFEESSSFITKIDHNIKSTQLSIIESLSKTGVLSVFMSYCLTANCKIKSIILNSKRGYVCLACYKNLIHGIYFINYLFNTYNTIILGAYRYYRKVGILAACPVTFGLEKCKTFFAQRLVA